MAGTANAPIAVPPVIATTGSLGSNTTANASTDRHRRTGRRSGTRTAATACAASPIPDHATATATGTPPTWGRSTGV
ncbi:hypothetical protein [Actinomadura sp. RB99]|uniref:hypothetical protein n=1 Tax=Actinomadura sp. RB99 TaxID=2691577 RepID=UPI001F509058|nr:hypothetical protein [Actinomadura sp. RB99]